MKQRIAAVLFLIFALTSLIFFLHGKSLPNEKQGAAQQRLIRIACVGDSITAGSTPQFGVAALRGDTSYPTQLQQLLGKQYAVLNFGIPSVTTQTAQDMGEVGQAAQFHPDYVFIMFGDNDFHQLSEQQFKSNLEKIVSQLTSNGAKVYLMSPPIPKRWDDLAHRLAPYNAIGRSISTKLGTPFLDFSSTAQDAWFDHDTDKNVGNFVYIHPSSAGYAAMATAIRDTVFNAH